ncbi:MAG: transposase [Acidobacteria bacterium]|nr:transposase [Acidobacteriota bacterium]
MHSIRIPKDMNNQAYFITLTILKWYYILDRHGRWNILLNSLKHCTKKKDIKIYAFVFMINHIHLIVQSPDVSGFLRDFKKHTSLEIMKNLRATEPSVARLFEGENGKFNIL